MIENWTELVIGALILISPWALGFADISLARWLNVFCGAILVLINVWAIYGKGLETSSEAEDMTLEKIPRQKPKRIRRAISVIKIKKVEESLINS